MSLYSVTFSSKSIWIHVVLSIVFIALLYIYAPWSVFRIELSDNYNVTREIRVILNVLKESYFIERIGNETYVVENIHLLPPLKNTSEIIGVKIIEGKLWFTPIVSLLVGLLSIAFVSYKKVRYALAGVSALYLLIYSIINIYDHYNIITSITQKYDYMTARLSLYVPISSIVFIIVTILLISINKKISGIVKELYFILKEYEIVHGHKIDEDSKICPKCGAVVPINAKYCPYCGYVFPASSLRYKICPHCGAKVPVEVRFCPHCGYDFGKEKT